MMGSILLSNSELSSGLLWQYAVVALIILLAVVKIIVSVIKKSRGHAGSCAGCSLASTCMDYKMDKKTSNLRRRTSGTPKGDNPDSGEMPKGGCRKCHK